jgi:hypothetical protein
MWTLVWTKIWLKSNQFTLKSVMSPFLNLSCRLRAYIHNLAVSCLVKSTEHCQVPIVRAPHNEGIAQCVLNLNTKWTWALPKVSPVPTGQEGTNSTAINLSKVIVCLVKYHDTENAFITSTLYRSVWSVSRRAHFGPKRGSRYTWGGGSDRLWSWSRYCTHCRE